MLYAIPVSPLPSSSLSSYRPFDSSNHCPVSIVGSCPDSDVYIRQDALQEILSSYKILHRFNTYICRYIKPNNSQRYIIYT